MADLKLTAWYTANPITLDPGDLGYAVENTGTTPASGGYKQSQLMRDYYLISATVSSNNLTVAIKHLDGTNPSTDRPLYFKINGSFRAITGALSVTVNAGAASGSGTFNSGATEFATKTIRYFVYLGYRAASSAVVIGFSRIPYANLYSEFSGTASNETYAAFSTAPASTDDVVNIGAFDAINSGTASYNFSVPTFTNTNLFSRPMFESGKLLYLPSFSNQAGSPNAGSSTLTGAYILIGRRVFVDIYMSVVTGGAWNAGTSYMLWKLPMTPGFNTSGFVHISDAGTGRFSGTVVITSSQVYANTATALVTNTAPMTPATGDEYFIGLSFFI